MTKYSSLFQKSIIYTILYFLFLQTCFSKNIFYDLDLSSQTLNPISTGFMMTGYAANDNFGYAVSTAGDVDNDGYDDIIVGAYGKSSSQGAAYIIYGGKESSFLNLDLSRTTLDPLTTGFMITGNVSPDNFGISVSTAGDIDGDGYDDIVVGAYRKSSLRGAVYVIYGGAKSSMSNIDLSTQTLIPTSTGFMITGDAVNDYLGWSVSTAGDIDNDGYDDIIVGAYHKNNFQGAAYVIYGGAKLTMSNIDLSSPLDPLHTGFMITGNPVVEQFAVSVSTAGDINNDGFADIIIGAYAKNSFQGAAYVIYGGAKSTMSNIILGSTILNPTSTGFMITGNAIPDRLGWSVSKAGDINNDGYDDIIVGAGYKNSQQGAAYVIYGREKSSMFNIDLSSTTLDPLTTGFTITGSAAGDYFGRSVSTAGDINRDGYGDIILGAPYKGNTQGAAYVIYGGPKSKMSNINLSTQTLNSATTGFMITGNAVGDYFGYPVSSVGDINNDGYSDIIVGAYAKNGAQGAAYVIYASCSKNCNQCSSGSVCTDCQNSYLMYQYKCLASCPTATVATSTTSCEDCPSYCSSCTSPETCKVCQKGFTLSDDSLCVLSTAQDKATQAISSATQGIGSVLCVGSAIVPFSALVSKIVQNTRYLNISVTNELSDVYETWNTDLIAWNVPNVMSNLDHFKTTPYLFAQYDIDSPFLVNFWPTLINIVMGFGTFIASILLKRLCEHEKYEGWAYSLLLKLVAGSFNFALVQAYACFDDILFYLVLDAQTNPFNSFFSWTSMIFAVLFLVLGCLLVFFNFWTVKKYQSIKTQGTQEIEAFNERNKYWELFYSDFSDEDLYTQSFFAFAVIRSALSSLIITVFYDYPPLQTSYLMMMDFAIISFLYFKNPLNTLRGTLAQYFYEIITLLVHLCTFILSLQDTFDNPSETVRKIMSNGILYLNTTLIMGAIGFMFIEIYKTISQKRRAARLRQRQSVPEDNSETQSLTQTANPLRPQDFINHQNLNLAHSQSNLNADHSRELDMFANQRFHEDQRRRPIVIRHVQQGNNSIFPIHEKNNQ